MLNDETYSSQKLSQYVTFIFRLVSFHQSFTIMEHVYYLTYWRRGQHVITIINNAVKLVFKGHSDSDDTPLFRGHFLRMVNYPVKEPVLKGHMSCFTVLTNFNGYTFKVLKI